MQKKKKSLVVVKSNKLIEARYDLSVNELRLILVYVSLLNPQDEKKPCLVEMKVKDYVNLLDIDSNRKDMYANVKSASQKLIEKSLAIQEKDGLLITTWFSSIKYFDKKGTVILKSSDDLKPYLFDLKKYFTQYKLFNVVRLASQYSIRIYELLKQYERVGKRSISIAELKLILGISKDQYPLYADFKRWVIKQSQKELKLKTDICFEFEETKKTGKKVEEITFYISENKDYDKQISVDEYIAEQEVLATTEITSGQMTLDEALELTADQHDIISKILEPLDLEATAIKNYEYSIEQLKKYVDIISKNKKNCSNPTGLLIYAIKNKLTPESLIPILKRQKKPSNMDNFEQREYTDEYFDNFFNNGV